ncbi:MAG: dUTP diphosphatase [Desulfovibrio sp.]|nr:dUTP diphosphatase [Desulfovibrio sp.]
MTTQVIPPSKDDTEASTCTRSSPDRGIGCRQLVRIKKLDPAAVTPTYKKHGDAGFDLYVTRTTTIQPHSTEILPTGLAFAIPEGFEMQVRLRSSTGLKTPLIIPNAPGTIDSGYRGEVGIVVRNLNDTPFTVNKGERIAQGILAPVFTASFVEVAQLPESERGDGGYGSTGNT